MAVPDLAVLDCAVLVLEGPGLLAELLLAVVAGAFAVSVAAVPCWVTASAGRAFCLADVACAKALAAWWASGLATARTWSKTCRCTSATWRWTVLTWPATSFAPALR